jgi:anti-sigma regulatory factor (Ser/Thr protein kinase)
MADQELSGSGPPPGRVFPRRIAALEEIFAFLGDFIDRHRLDDDTSYAIRFAAEELFTNMVKYNKGTAPIGLRVAVDEAGRTVRLELTDSGVDPFDPSSLQAVNVDAPLEERVPGGLGLHLVRALVDDLSYDYADREMKVTVTKRLRNDG